VKLNDLERKLFRAGQLDLAEAAFVASGVKTRGELKSYLDKIDHLCAQIGHHLASGKPDVDKARAIFEWLWETKPNRYKSGGNFKLTEVIDAQLDEGKNQVGNCLGLTIIYNALAQRSGLVVKATHLEDAFGMGPHVCSILHTEEGTIDIENVFRHGFGYRGHLGNPKREEWGNAELVADLYLSIGNSLFDLGELKEAVENYDKAIWLNPGYTKAYLNKAIASSQLREKAAKRGTGQK